MLARTSRQHVILTTTTTAAAAATTTATAKKMIIKSVPFVSRTLFTKSSLTTREQIYLSKDSYDDILRRKSKLIEGLLRPFMSEKVTREKNDDDASAGEEEEEEEEESVVEFEVFESPKLRGFRQRCRFGIVPRESAADAREEDDRVRRREKFDYSIYERNTLTRIESKFEIASKSIESKMDALRTLMNEDERFSSLGKGKLSAVTFHENRASTECVITLWKGEKIESDFADVAGVLADEIGVKAIVARAKGEKKVSNNSKDDFVIEEMHVLNRTMKYKQPEGSFSNPNGDIAEITANWLSENMQKDAKQEEEDENNNKNKKARNFVEFYCGNMNHGCYLAPHFPNGRVIGIERDETLCEAAKTNIELNGVKNAVIINAPAEVVARRFLSHLKRKEKVKGEAFMYPFDENDFILVDPPRAGLDEITLDLVRNFRDVIYISCDARSLVRDLGELKLSETHRIKRIAAFDHFPWHADFLEVVCWLEKK